jgi:nitrate/nitrite transport system substrate-binding protein
MKQIGETPPDIAGNDGYRPITVMGRTFDSSRPDAYLNGFGIKRA